MGKQKMTKKHVQMIKHLYFNRQWTIKQLQELVDMSREGIRDMIKGRTWPEITTPEFTLGEERYYHFLNNFTFD